MRFGSVCSGIEAASVAWPFWEAAWFSEIEPFPCAVLKHHYPEVPNHGDMTALPDRILSGEVEAPDVFCGGTPCQAFSVAGNRKSLDDARGNLSLTFCEIADAIDTIRQQRNQSPAIIFWENVPGVLNTKDNAFGCFLAELAGEAVPLQPSGGRWTDAGFVSGPKRTIAWRVLDAQYFGLAQRRRRVFLCAVKHGSRKGFNPSEVLFEFNSLRRDTAPSRQAGQGIAADAETGFKLHETVGTLCADTHPGSYSGQDAYTGRLIPVCAEISPTEPLCFEPRSPDGHARVIGNIAPCLNTMGGGQREPCVTYEIQGNMIGRADTADPQGNGYSEELTHTLDQAQGQAVAAPTYSIRPDVTPKFYEDIAGTIGATDYKDPTCVATITTGHDQQVAVPLAFAQNQLGEVRASAEVFNTLNTNSNASGRNTAMVAQQVAVGIDLYNCTITGDLAATLSTRNGIPDATGPRVMTSYAVRRLTPVECERLQGFPDNYTNIPWRKKPESPDGPRYKALGNSWAVPVVRWIGERINNAVNRL